MVVSGLYSSLAIELYEGRHFATSLSLLAISCGATVIQGAPCLIALPSTAQHCPALPITAHHCPSLPSTAQHCPALPSTAQHCSILFRHCVLLTAHLLLHLLPTVSWIGSRGHESSARNPATNRSLLSVVRAAEEQVHLGGN